MSTADAPPSYSRYERVYLVLAATFVVLLILTNVVGAKLFASPLHADWALTTGILTYPFTFLVTDLVSEIYGKRRADFMVLLGFVLSFFMLGVLWVAQSVPAHPAWASGGFYTDGWIAGAGRPPGDATQGYQHAFESVFAVNGVLLFGSMLAYMVAQLTDNWLFHFWKRLTHGRHLWLRNNGSTWISQLLDTAIVNSILFYVGFGMELWTGVWIMLTIYLHKLILAVLDTPMIYLGVWLIRRVLADELDAEGRLVGVDGEVTR
ncbi:MAG: queuosine precursor transporter [Alphaproteobacteria bacterium]|nr:queuosine precursor transporter [Alphaproteobacteria bacterium]